ncbi:hypothetical protein PHYBOEH_005498 [Phytophthora boehmeriae]|uniref:Uncharacterized protein n=1 Tax=Phytophthora boehmeriae TaxID=109152 RepID=A0A8T1XAM2_9STRA|nr:hypothetical protein PHYBOEH_005498 [Phytophthora boehmeriae]
MSVSCVIQFARTMGADAVVAFPRSANKDAIVDHTASSYKRVKKQASAAADKVNVLLSYANAENMPYTKFLSALAVRGTMQGIQDMLKIASKKNVRAVIQRLPMSKANESIKLACDGSLQGISIEDCLDEEAFLKTLEESLQQHVATLSQQFLVLSASQVDRLAFRLHDALVPKRDVDTRVIQAWTIQPQLQLKVKASAHIQVLKLSTILREVQWLRVHQPQIFDMAEDEKEEQQKARAPIEMEIFPSLRVVEALNTKVTALRNVHFFAHQLRELHIEHTEVRALYLLLAPEAEKDENGALKAAGWRKLVKFQMNCCALATVDQSVNLLQAVRTLDLGWNQIEHFNTAMTTKSLEVLNLCHNQLLQVPPIQSLRSLKELDLAVNQLSSLKGIAALTALERLDVSHNQIADIAEVELLTRLPRLAFLKMEFNPIAQRPDYRREVLFFLGGQIELDGHEWSDAELNSMENRRKLRMIEHVKEPNVLWGQAADVPGYPKTVDDYFKTQRDVIITSERTCSKKQMNGDEDSNVSIVRKRVRTRSRKYTASDFMRDFEEEESLLREGNNVSNEMEMLVTRSSSQTHMTSLQSTGQRINIRVLLSAKEAAEYDLHFGIDGVPATIEIKVLVR